MKIGKCFLVILAISMFFSSCTKVSEEVIGTWTFQTFDDSPQGTMTWNFKDDGQLIRVATTDNGIQFDSCNYEVDKSLLTTKINISGSNDLTGFTSVNGIFRVDKLKDDILIMTRERLSDDEVNGAYLKCEMIRKM